MTDVRKYARIRSAILFLALFLALGTPFYGTDALAQSEIEMDRGSLRNLRPLYVSVYVEGNAGLTDLPGLDVSALHSAVDSTLTARGIPIDRGEPARVLDREPYISVHINAMDMGEGLTPFAIEVQIIQGVIVANVPNELIHAATWDTGLVGLVSRDKVDSIKWAMVELVEEFAEDYFSVNPM